MSRETLDDLNANTLVGMTLNRGNAWHYRVGNVDSARNHFPGAVPMDSVLQLFGWDALSLPLRVDMPETYTPKPIEIEPGIFVDDPRGMTPIVADRQAIVRSDTGAVLGIFSDGYEIHQYQDWLLHRVSNILGDTLQIGSAGLLKGGAQAWVSVEVPENITTPEGEVFRPNLLACTSHDGSLATRYKRVVTRVVCDNTMSAGLGEAGQELRIKHSKYSKLRIDEARDALAMVHSIAEDYMAEVAALTRVHVSDRAWSQFLDAHVPLIDPKTKADKTGTALTNATTKREELTQLWNNDTRVSPWRNTGWGVLQAVNTHTHHVANVRIVSRPERNMSNAVDGTTEKADKAAVSTLTRVLADA